MTDTATTSPRAASGLSLAVPDGELLTRAKVACGRAERLHADTASYLDRSALLRARLRWQASRVPETLAGLRDRLRSAEAEVENLEMALSSNRRIGMAVGILMRGLPASETQAFEMLRQESMHANVKLRDLAEQVIYTGTL